MDILSQQEQTAPFHTINIMDNDTGGGLGGLGTPGTNGGFPTFETAGQTPGLAAMLDHMGRTMRTQLKSGALSPDQAAAMDADPGNLVAAYQTIRTQHGFDDAYTSKLLSSSIRAFGTAANAAETAPLIHSIAKARNDDPFLVARRLEQERGLFNPAFLTPDRKGDPVAEDDANTMFMSAVRGIHDYETKYGIVMPSDIEAKVLAKTAARASEARQYGLSGVNGDALVESAARSLGYLSGGTDDDPVSKFSAFRDQNHLRATVFGANVDHMIGELPDARGGQKSGDPSDPRSSDYLITELLAGVLDRAGAQNLNAGRAVDDFDAAHDGIISGFTDALRKCLDVGQSAKADRMVNRVAENLLRQRKENGSFDFSKAIVESGTDPSKITSLEALMAEKAEKARQAALAAMPTATDDVFAGLSKDGYFTGTPLRVSGVDSPTLVAARAAFKKHGDDDRMADLKSHLLVDAQAWDKTPYRRSDERPTDALRRKTRLASAFQMIDMVQSAVKSGVLDRSAGDGLIKLVYDDSKYEHQDPGKDPLHISVMSPVDQSKWRLSGPMGKYGKEGNFAYEATPGAAAGAAALEGLLYPMGSSGSLPGKFVFRSMYAPRSVGSDPMEKITRAIAEAGGDPDHLSGPAANVVKAAKLVNFAMDNYHDFVESVSDENNHYWSTFSPFAYANNPERMIEEGMRNESMLGLTKKEQANWRNYHEAMNEFKSLTGATFAGLAPSGIDEKKDRLAFAFAKGPTAEEEGWDAARKIIASIGVHRSDIDDEEAAILNRMFLSYANRAPGMRRFVERSMGGIVQAMVPEWKPGSGAYETTVARLVRLHDQMLEDQFTNRKADGDPAMMMLTPEAVINDPSLLTRKVISTPRTNPDGSPDKEHPVDVQFEPIDVRTMGGLEGSVANSAAAQYLSSYSSYAQKMMLAIKEAAAKAAAVSEARDEVAS